MDNTSQPPKNDRSRPIVDRKHLFQSIEDGFPSVYLTLLSVIQGVALFFWAEHIYEYFIEQSGVNGNIALAVMSLGYIIVIWYEYSWLVRIFVWNPTPLDSISPFLLGVFEIVPTLFFDKPDLYLLFVGILALVGSLCYCNSRWHTDDYLFGDKDNKTDIQSLLQKLFRKRYLMSIIGSSVLGGILITLALTCRFCVSHRWSSQFLPLYAYIIASIVLALFYAGTFWTAEEAVQEILQRYELVKHEDKLRFIRKKLHKIWHRLGFLYDE